MGLFWSFAHPLLMLAVFTLVFGSIFKARWATEGPESTLDFALIVFVGLIIHAIFAECMNRAPTLILSNANLVKKVVFPLEVFPIVAMGSTLFHAAVSFLVWLLFFAIAKAEVHWTLIFLPIVVFPLVLVAMGVAWFFAATGVFVRDIAQITGVISSVLLFLSPIFYPASALPEPYRALMAFNPLTVPVEQARNVMVWGRLPDLPALSAYAAVALAICFAGLAWFQRTRRAFADVL